MSGEISVASLEERLATELFSVDMLTDVCRAVRRMHFREWFANRALLEAEEIYNDYLKDHYSDVVPNPESFNPGQTMPDEAFLLGGRYIAARTRADSQRRATITRVTNVENILQKNFDEKPTKLRLTKQTGWGNTARVQYFGEARHAQLTDDPIREPLTGIVKGVQLLRSIRPIGSQIVGGEIWDPLCTLFLQPTEQHHREIYRMLRAQIGLVINHPNAASTGKLPEMIRNFDLSTAVELIDSE